MLSCGTLQIYKLRTMWYLHHNVNGDVSLYRPESDAIGIKILGIILFLYKINKL